MTQGGSWVKVVLAVALVAVMVTPTGMAHGAQPVLRRRSPSILPYGDNITPSGTCMIRVCTTGTVSTSGSPIENITVGTDPTGVGYDSGNGDIYVDNTNCPSNPCGQGSVTVINGSTNNVVANINVGTEPWGVAYDSGKGEVFVPNYGSSNVSVINGSTNSVVATVPVGLQPRGAAYDRGNGQVYVVNLNSNNVSVINGITNVVVATVPVGTWPEGVVYDSGNGAIYVTNDGSGNVSVISGGTNTVVATIPVGSEPIGAAYDDGNGDVYVTSYLHVSVINGSTNKVVATINTGTYPHGAAYGNGDVYVANFDFSSVSVINGSTNNVVATVDVGTEPTGVAYDRGNGYIYVTNWGSNNVTAILTNLSVATQPTSALGPAWLNVSFKSNPFAGSWNYTAWSWSFGDGNHSVLQNPVHTYMKPGNYQAKVTVTDSSGAKATSIAIWINVTHPLPFQVMMVPSQSSIAVGQTVWYNVSANLGGVLPLSFKWNATPLYAGCVASNSSFVVATCTPTRPNIVVSLGVVEVTDLYGATYNHTVGNVTVSSLAATLSVSKTSVSVGQPVIFNTSTSGDADTLSYGYTSPPTAGCAAYNGPSITCIPQKPGGSFTVNVTVTDQYGNTWNATSPLVTVVAGSVSLGSSATSVEVGQSVQFDSTIASIGSGVTYAYTAPVAAGCISSSTATVICTPQKPGWSFTVNVTVTDLYGNTWRTSSPMVSTGTLTASIATSRTAVDVNESLTLTTQTTGDLAPLAFAYTSPALAGCAASTGASVVCVPKSTGAFSVTVQVVDSYGNTWSVTSGSVKVYPALEVSLTVSSSTPLLAQTVAFVANASGGNPAYNYTYLGLPYGCYSEDKSSIGCLPTQSDWYNITVVVKDLNNGTAEAMVTMHVIFDFNVVIPASTPVGKQLTIMVNTNETFNGSAINKSALIHPEGGYGTFTYAYSGLPPGCTSADVALLTCTPTLAGKYSVTVSVHDQAGDHQTHTVLVNIVPASGLGGVLGSIWGSPYAMAGIVAGAIAIIAGVVLFLRKKRSKMGSSKATTDKESTENEEQTPKETASKDSEEEKAPESTQTETSPEPEKND